METPEKDQYFIAVKLLLRDGDKLLITHDIFGSWDLPGGRLLKDEFKSPFEAVLARKMSEEIGTDVKYKLGEPTAYFRVERAEHNMGGEMVRIFAIGFAASYISGEVVLGPHHDQMEWVDVNTFEPEKYFTGGWLAGVQEYLHKIRRT